MNKLIKRILLFVLLCLTTSLVHSQVWTAEDSLRLKKLLDSDNELHLNRDVIRQIDFGRETGSPQMSLEKSWMQLDETLPTALPKPKMILTLMPYTANTKYNWDPIYQKKISVDKNTWRGDPFYELRHQRSYSNETRNPIEGAIPLRSGVSVSGNTFSGLDLMTGFTKDFWDVKGRKRRARTLEILKHYGDSTSIMINDLIEQIAR